ncbi:tetraspanin-8 [Camelus bactrianus]|uniref:tetraspanin-8 n=1 Tax=Camelus bactrianus TaxID=9837 RepID=UPI000579C1DF|nr:PREDICTED: tetraspanin-8 [Camelus bactrianus]
MAGVNACVKCSIFIFNFMFWLCGVVILATAIWLRESKDGREILSPEGLGTNPNIAANILIAVGSIIMMLGFLGCCGAMKENRFILVLFLIGLLLVLLLQVSAGILAFTLKTKTDHVLNDGSHANMSLLSLKNEDRKMFQKAFSEIQEKYKCCGLVNGASDWGNNFQYYYKSCECPDASDSSCTSYSGKTIYKQTCLPLVRGLVSRHFSLVTGLAFGLAAVEILAVIFSIVLYGNTRKK